MPVKGKVQVVFSAVTGDLVSAFDKIDKALLHLAGRFLLFRGTIAGLGDVLSPIKKMVTAAADLEDFGITLTTIFQSAAKAAKVTNDLSEFAVLAPFDLPGLRQSAIQLTAYGVGADRVIDTLKAIGEISSASGQPLEYVIDLYGRVLNVGRLSGHELTNLGRQGIPIYEELAKVLGTIPQRVRQLAIDQKISFTDFDQAIRNMSASGGRFFGLMEERSKGLKGLLINFGDAITVLFEAVGTTLVEKTGLKQLLSDVQALAYAYTHGLKPQLDSFINKLISLAVSVGNVIVFIVKLAAGLFVLIAAFTVAIVVVKLLMLGLAGLLSILALLLLGVVGYAGVVEPILDSIKSKLDFSAELEAARKELDKVKEKWKDLGKVAKPLDMTPVTDFDAHQMDEFIKKLKTPVEELEVKFREIDTLYAKAQRHEARNERERLKKLGDKRALANLEERLKIPGYEMVSSFPSDIVRGVKNKLLEQSDFGKAKKDIGYELADLIGRVNDPLGFNPEENKIKGMLHEGKITSEQAEVLTSLVKLKKGMEDLAKVVEDNVPSFDALMHKLKKLDALKEDGQDNAAIANAKLKLFDAIGKDALDPAVLRTAYAPLNSSAYVSHVNTSRLQGLTGTSPIVDMKGYVKRIVEFLKRQDERQQRRAQALELVLLGNP